MSIKDSQRWIIVEIVRNPRDPDEEEYIYDFCYISKFEAYSRDLDGNYGDGNWTIVATAADDRKAGLITRTLQAEYDRDS